MHTRIIVAHPRLHRCLAGHDGTWIYADEKLGYYDQICSSLGNKRLLITPKRFQEEAQRLVLNYIPWADEQIQIDDSVEWLLTPLHRNPFGSNLMLHIFWLRLLDLYGNGQHVIVFTESVGLARACAALCEKSGWKFACKGRRWLFLRWLRVSLRSVAKLAYDVLRSFVGWLGARVMLGREQLAKLQSTELLIDAYLYSDSISTAGDFRDKHLPGLYEWYQGHGIATAIYPFPVGVPVYQYLKLFHKMKTCSVPMLPFELLLRLGDIPCAAFSCLRRGLQSSGRHHFEDTDVTALIAGERFRAATSGVLPLLLAVAPARLSDSAIKPRWFLDWFENQPIDRATVFGFAKTGCRVVALRLYSLYPMFASLFTSERELLAGVCPANAWVSGVAMEEQLSRYDRLTNYARVPALRYGHLYTAGNQPSGRGASQGRKLALLLTHSAEESLAILDCTLSALLLMPELFAQVIVKPHPDYGMERLRKTVALRWPWADKSERFKWETRALATVLSEASVIISSGTSAAIEAVCHGIPVILIGRKAGLDMSPLAEMDSRLWRTVYEPEDLATVLRQWVPTHPLSLDKRREIGEIIRQRNYEPSTPQSFEVFGELLHEMRAID